MPRARRSTASARVKAKQNVNPVKLIIRTESGQMCSCATYMLDVYSDGSMRYEFSLHGKQAEFRIVPNVVEFEMAYTAFLEALHGPRH